jgi:hypothetical protein
MSAEPKLVELLYFDGCPGIERVMPVVDPLAEAAGARVIKRRVETAQEAEAQRFLGSPTVRVNGVDVEPGAEQRTDYGLKCRLYRTEAGLTGVPEEDWVRDALQHATPSQHTVSDLQPPTITEILGDDRWAADRISGLDPDARRLYALILYRFTEGGPPDRDELSRLGLGDDALSELIERDLVQLGPDSQVAVAYPFSTMPTRHQVRTEHGQTYWAMCAIDALGMPYLLHQATEIRAREPGSDRAITIAIDPAAQTLRPDPAGAAVAVARTGDGCAAACACPHINLFGSTAAAEGYLASSDLHGAILDVGAATAAGRRVFGDLLDRLGASTRQ